MDAFNEYVKLDRSNGVIMVVRDLISAYVSGNIVDMYESRDYDYSFYEMIDRKMKEKHIIVDDKEFDNLRDLANYLADEDERISNLPPNPVRQQYLIKEYEKYKDNPDIFFALHFGIGENIDDFIERNTRRYREYEKRLGLKSDIDDEDEDDYI
jgi:hypothetical protein